MATVGVKGLTITSCPGVLKHVVGIVRRGTDKEDLGAMMM